MIYTDQLKYFKGKVCTFTTVQINFRFKEEQMMDYFMGVVESIDQHTIMLVHPTTKCKTCIAMDHIVAIAEEQVLYDNNPEHAKIIEEYRKEKPEEAAKTSVPQPPQAKMALPHPPFVNPKELSEIAKKAKESFQKIERKP